MADYGGIDRSPNFNELNLNKRSLSVDLTTPAGLDLVRRLIATCDIVVENFRPGVMRRLGLGPEELMREQPALIVASSSANGATGPDAMGAGLASIFAATGGLSDQTGHADGPPTEVGESTDYRSANAFAVAILAAIIYRDRTGQGQYIDHSSREAIAATAPDALLALAAGAAWEPRIGNGNRNLAPHDVYPAADEDGWIGIAVRDDCDWSALCDLVGRPGWANLSLARRRERAAEIDAAIAAWTRQRPALESFLICQQHGIPAGPSLTNAQLVADPHLAARGVFVTVEHPVIGSTRVMRAPWLLANTPCEITRHGPLLGQDNAYVLGELLGMSRAEQEDVAAVLR
jgi:benzylsuccinate CoA-transferase BbsF subunit